MTTRTICMVGGTGFVGRHLAARLVQDRHHIKVLTRRRERHRDLLVLPGLQLIEADIHDPETLAREFAGCDVIINLVGILNERGHRGEGFRRAHVELPRKVVEACRQTGVTRLLHMSALGADAKEGRSHYQRTKGEGEDLVHAAEGIAVTSFRPSVIFGRGDSFLNRFAELLRITPYFFPLACANARFAPVFVGDVVEAFTLSLGRTATEGQRYELCGPRAYTLRELVEYTARLLGLKRKIIPLGNRLSRLQAEILEWVPGKPFSRDNYLSLQTDSVCSGPFPPLFGIEPTPLENVAPSYLGRCHPRS